MGRRARLWGRMGLGPGSGVVPDGGFIGYARGMFL